MTVIAPLGRIIESNNPSFNYDGLKQLAARICECAFWRLRVRLNAFFEYLDRSIQLKDDENQKQEQIRLEINNLGSLYFQASELIRNNRVASSLQKDIDNHLEQIQNPNNIFQSYIEIKKLLGEHRANELGEVLATVARSAKRNEDIQKYLDSILSTIDQDTSNGHNIQESITSFLAKLSTSLYELDKPLFKAFWDFICSNNPQSISTIDDRLVFYNRFKKIGVYEPSTQASETLGQCLSYLGHGLELTTRDLLFYYRYLVESIPNDFAYRTIREHIEQGKLDNSRDLESLIINLIKHYSYMLVLSNADEDTKERALGIVHRVSKYPFVYQLNNNTKECLEIADRAFDIHHNFGVYTYDAMKNGQSYLLHRFAHDCMAAIRAPHSIFSRDSKGFPGRGLWIQGLDPFKTFNIRDESRLAKYEHAYDWAGDAFKFLDSTNFIFTRGMIIVFNDNEEFNLTANGRTRNYAYVVWNDHHHHNGKATAALVPTNLIKEIINRCAYDAHETSVARRDLKDINDRDIEAKTQTSINRSLAIDLGNISRLDGHGFNVNGFNHTDIKTLCNRYQNLFDIFKLAFAYYKNYGEEKILEGGTHRMINEAKLWHDFKMSGNRVKPIMALGDALNWSAEPDTSITLDTEDLKLRVDDKTYDLSQEASIVNKIWETKVLPKLYNREREDLGKELRFYNGDYINSLMAV